MKKICYIICLILLSATACQKKVSVWSDPQMWYQSENEYDSTKVDVLYFVSTNVMSARDSSGNVSWTSLLSAEDRDAINREMSWVENIMFHSDFNFISPYYHQYTFESVCKLDKAEFGLVLKDVVDEACDAFDYYMTHRNKGRKFILAGFSQGAMLALEVVKHMSGKQLENMVVCYMPGYRLSAEDLQHPNVRAATGASDTGVVISFNSVQSLDGIWTLVTEGAATCINPVNWCTDTTSASFSFSGTNNTVHLDTDANVLVVETDNPQFFQKYYEKATFFKDAGVNTNNLHHWDLLFYASFIHDNALLRSGLLK